MGVIQKNLSSSSFESNNFNYNLIIEEPDQSLVKAIENSKNYKKMIEEQERANSEDKQIIKDKKAASVVKILIEGDNIIPEFVPNSKEEDKKEENLINGFDLSERNNNNININSKNINDNSNNINIINEKDNEIKENSTKFRNNKNIDNINNNIISQKEEKNSNEDKDIINSNGIDTNNKNMEQLKSSPETIDKSDIKLFDSEKKERKKSSFMEKELDAKDKLKNLKIEITCKNLEDQIKLLLEGKNIVNN
jgi:hypothetical protein